MKLRAMSLAVLIGTGAGCGGVNGLSVSDITGLTGNAISGETIYTQNCERCHGSSATGGSANRNLPSVVKSSLSSAASVVISGDDEMPAFSSTLTNQQIADVLAYLKTL